MNPEIQRKIDEAILNHIHDGNYAQRVNFPDIFLYTFPQNATTATIATTGTTNGYFIAPYNMTLSQAIFSGGQSLAASDTNYITFTITNLAQDGLTSTAMLAAVDANTTKATGGTALILDIPRTFTISTSANALQVRQGDRINVAATVTGTLANTVVFPNYMLIFQ